MAEVILLNLSIFKLRVGASISRLVCPSVCPSVCLTVFPSVRGKNVKNCQKSVKNLSKKIFVKGNDHLSMYGHESSMKLSFGGTLDTRTACEALKKIKECYMKRTKTFEYKTNKY